VLPFRLREEALVDEQVGKYPYVALEPGDQVEEFRGLPQDEEVPMGVYCVDPSP
jgi:hypothetical protein